MPLNPVPNWPGTGLDSLPDPTQSTYEDDDGFELDLLLQKHNAILEAAEAKLGSTVTGTPVRGKALFGAGASAGLWDVVGRRNRLINGSMVVNQRVTMPTADNSYTLDRWRLLLGAASACTVTHETSDTPAGGSRRAIKLAVTATNNNKFGIFSPLEGQDIWDLRGQVVSLSFWAKVSNARIGDVRGAVLQWTSTEDNVSATPINTWGNEGAGITTYTTNWAQANTPANVSPTTSWARYYIEGITISASANNLGVFIWSDDKTTTNGDYLLITDVQLEKGAVCTDVERLPFSRELAACQRYYQKTFAYGTAPAQASGSTVGAIGYIAVLAGASFDARPWTFPVVMRAAPTITYYNPISSNATWRNISSSIDSGNAASLFTSDRAVTVANNPQVAGDTVGAQIAIHAQAVAEL